MRDLAFIAGFSMLVTGAYAGQIIKVVGFHGDGQDQTYNLNYSTAREVTVSGTVTGKIKGSPRNGMAETMAILMKDRAGKTYSVDLGPTWYVGQQVTSVKIGDKIKVIGEPVVSQTTANNKDHFIVARQIRKGHQVLVLRDLSGNPYWNAYRPGKVAISGAPNSLTGTIVSQNPVTAEKQQQVGYQIQTPNGLVNVAVAPNWYLQQQGLGFHVGDSVTVYTGVGPANYGGVLLADGIYGSSGTIVLRPGGVPAWAGWGNVLTP